MVLTGASMPHEPIPIFLGSTGQRPFLRPDLPVGRLPRAGAVNDGPRPPPRAARRGMDAPKHGDMRAGGSGRRNGGAVTKNTVALPRRAGKVHGWRADSSHNEYVLKNEVDRPTLRSAIHATI